MGYFIAFAVSMIVISTFITTLKGMFDGVGAMYVPVVLLVIVMLAASHLGKPER